MGRLSAWTLIGLMLLTITALHDVRADAPTENECRPFVEKALHDLKAVETPEGDAEGIIADDGSSGEEANDPNDGDSTEVDEVVASVEATDDDGNDDDDDTEATVGEDSEGDDADEADDAQSEEAENKSGEDENDSADQTDDAEEDEDEATRTKRSAEDEADDDDTKDEAEDAESGEDGDETEDAVAVDEEADDDDTTEAADDEDDGADSKEESDAADSKEEDGAEGDDEEPKTDEDEEDNKSDEAAVVDEESQEEEADSKEEDAETDDSVVKADDVEDTTEEEVDEAKSVEEEEVEAESAEETEGAREKREVSDEDSKEDDAAENEQADTETADDGADSVEEAAEPTEAADEQESEEEKKEDEIDSKENEAEDSAEPSEGADDSVESSQVTKPIVSFPEDDLLMEFVVPANLRDHSHVTELLRLDEEFDEKEAAINKAADGVLKQLKTIYENAIKPLETLYKYRDLSNRHFGDPEIFSKPLVLFMGPWSGGKSTILNYLTENEHTADSIRTGAEPSPAYFNILMHGDKPEVLDGTQLAADWTFSGLQKFGQGLEERLRGQKLPHKLLEKVNIVEIPGILEVRKTVNRLFPFNDACQWFIDRADIIFLVYDPSKLDVGPETEAILDQLKGREYQTRILLNKADQVKPEELLRVQGALIWNISPLMSSAQPPVMYTTSLWSHPFEEGAPVRLLQAQERSFLRDLRAAMDKRIDNKIASARRFAVRVRNHAKMVDCYLTTYYNHKTLFGNKKQIADNIIENPSNYHIYEGLSTLTNISRYDLPDPDVYKDFFRLNKLYEFKKLSETCTYFRGCPINKLDVAIAYDLPELVGKYKKAVEAALLTIEKSQSDGGKR